MLVYAKKVDGERVIYGSEGNIPTESDEPVSYRDDQRKVVDIGTNPKLRCGARGKMQLIKEDGSKQNVNVWIKDKSIIPRGLEGGEKSKICNIDSFKVKINGTNYTGTINESATPNPTISITAKAGDTITGLKPVIVISTEATVSPASKESVDFVSGTAKDYVVTAEDTSVSKTYKVTITVPASEG